MTQLTDVLEAVKSGCQTSAAVSATTGLPLKRASTVLSALHLSGMIRTKPHIDRSQGRRNGRPVNVYEPLIQQGDL